MIAPTVPRPPHHLCRCIRCKDHSCPPSTPPPSTMPLLGISGASLEHTTTGSGPHIILVPGAPGSQSVFRFLERHPDLPLKTCVAHEPPSIMVLPAEVLPEREGMHRALYALYREKGAPHALETFASFFGDEKDRAGMGLLMDPAASADMRADVTYWLERECPYVFEKVDLEALGKAGDRLVLSVGERRKDGVMGQPTFALMERLGMSEERLLVVPGGHISYITDAEELAATLSRL